LHHNQSNKLKMKPTLKSVQQGVKNGLTPNQMAEQHGLTYKNFLAHMKKFGGFKKLKNEFGSPQFKAHQTMRKNELIAKYTTATSSGIKASISKEYQKTFGGLLKAELNSKIVAPKVVAPKVDKKIAFQEKEVQYMIPIKIKEMFNELHQKIHSLELVVEQMSKK
jgi:hypothetical protein